MCVFSEIRLINFIAVGRSKVWTLGWRVWRQQLLEDFFITRIILHCIFEPISSFISSMGQYLHLSYLQQVSDLLRSEHLGLAARLGYIAKKIQQKHLVHIKGIDAPRLRKCKTCQAPLNVEDIRHEQQWILVKCPLCGLIKRYGLLADKKHAKKVSPKKRKRKKATTTKPSDELEIIEVPRISPRKLRKTTLLVRKAQEGMKKKPPIVE